MPTKADLAAILEHNGLEFPDRHLSVTVGSGRHEIKENPYEVLRQTAKAEGLKAITERLRYGRKLAEKGGGKFRWEHFLDAHLRIKKQSEVDGEWS